MCNPPFFETLEQTGLSDKTVILSTMQLHSNNINNISRHAQDQVMNW